MGQINNNTSPSILSPSPVSESSSSPTASEAEGAKVHIPDGSAESGSISNPYISVNWNTVNYSDVDWSKVNYSATDYKDVDWSKINYSVVADADTSAQASSKTTATSSVQSAPQASTASQSSPTANTVNTPSIASSSTYSGGRGPGVYLTNSSSSAQTYSFYNNASNGDGTANPTYKDPTKTVTLQPGQTQFVSLPSSFKGRVQRTDGDANENTWATASTWAEFRLDGTAHGDITYQPGDDGAATIASTDGSNQVGGTTQDILSDAPADVLSTSATGGKAIANNTNAAATAYIQSEVNESQAYTGFAGSGTNDISSKNDQLAITFY